MGLTTRAYRQRDGARPGDPVPAGRLPESTGTAPDACFQSVGTGVQAGGHWWLLLPVVRSLHYSPGPTRYATPDQAFSDGTRVRRADLDVLDGGRTVRGLRMGTGFRARRA